MSRSPRAARRKPRSARRRPRRASRGPAGPSGPSGAPLTDRARGRARASGPAGGRRRDQRTSRHRRFPPSVQAGPGAGPCPRARPADRPACRDRAAASGPPAALLPARASEGDYGACHAAVCGEAVSREERRVLVEALRPAQEAAFGPGEYVEQESFVRASEIRRLAERAGVGPGVSLLDLCCGAAGPGRFLARQLRCDYLGVDSSESAVAVALERAAGLPCRFEVREIPPLPAGRFEVVLLLETMLAFPDKKALLTEIARALSAGGRFAFTLEEGAPLTGAERARMPAADTVWLTPLEELEA